jgi:type II secretion system protein I
MAARGTTLILKAGISMYRNNTTDKGKSLIAPDMHKRAFTFLEVIVALAIVSISMLTLLKLHLISVRMIEAAETTFQAVFLADEKIAEILALGCPQEGIYSGTVKKNNFKLNWQTEVTDLQMPQLQQAGITGLRKVLVDVSWEQAHSRKHLKMSTYVAGTKFNEQ